jgi:hypothetical protein
MNNQEAAEEQRATLAREQRINYRLAEAEASIAHLRHCARLQDSATAAVLGRAERAEIELAALREQLRLCNIDQANAEAENAALREDAKRYRWLRDNINRLPYDDYGMGPQFPSGNELDAAIDNCKEGA